MRSLLLELTLIFVLITDNKLIRTEVEESPQQIQYFEYGVHVPGESRSFRYIGTIPHLSNIFHLNITPTEEGLEKRYTYMRVEYVNAVSNIIIKYDPETHMLSMAVVFPLIETPFGVIGYSMPLSNEPILKN